MRLTIQTPLQLKMKYNEITSVNKEKFSCFVDKDVVIIEPSNEDISKNANTFKFRDITFSSIYAPHNNLKIEDNILI